MSMLDVAKYLSYSKSIDLTPERERYFNLSMVNSNRLCSCLDSMRRRPADGNVLARNSMNGRTD